MPSPAASAQALQCGTPGHGSGSRSRHTPGRIRSPRPTSPRVGLRMDRHANANVPARVFEPTLEPVATGVWLLRGGVPRTMNAYLLQDDGGVTVFDTGSRAMGPALLPHAGTLGGIPRVVLSHAHVDHRGGAPRIGLPVWTHPLERADAEGDAGRHYMHLERFPPVARWIYPRLQDRWDGGPVGVAGTIEEGEEVAGFTVI